MPKTSSSKPVAGKNDNEQNVRFDPKFIPSRLRRWKLAAKELHKTSCTNYVEIKNYLGSIELTFDQKQAVAEMISKSFEKKY